MAFSESFGLGNSTFMNLDTVAQNALEIESRNNSNQLETNVILDVIEESPTNAKNKLGKSRIKDTTSNTQHLFKRRRRLQKSKSDSTLDTSYSKAGVVTTSLKKDNYSDFFKSDFSLSKNNIETNVQNACINVSELEMMCKNEESKKMDPENNSLSKVFDDSDGFSQLLKEPIVNVYLINQSAKDLVKKSHTKSWNLDNPICSQDLAAALQETNFSVNSNGLLECDDTVQKDTQSKEDVEEIINIDDSSFLFLGTAPNEGDFIHQELKTSKADMLAVLKSDSLYKQKTKANSKDRSINISTCDKSILSLSLNINDDKSEQIRRNSDLYLEKTICDSEKQTGKEISCIRSKNIIHEENNSYNPKGKHEDLKKISSWNLPNSVLKEYENKGIYKMFDWQIECLQNPKVLFEHCNLVYSAPTSAGKTLVSEILMIKTVLERNKKAIFILPFISVVREKMFYLQDLLTSSGYRVEGFFGSYNPPGGFESINVAICTIEKANAIINKLLEQNKLDDIGIVVVDEIHLISDPGRGYILELLLAKILYMSKKYTFQIQIIAMSATLANIELLKNWLSSELYITNFRPVELQEMIKIGNKIFNNEMTLLREIETKEFKILNDPDNVCQLSLETISDGCSVVIFCPSKDWCESLSMQLAGSIHAFFKTDSEISKKLRKHLNKDLLDDVKKQLNDIPTGLDSVLSKTITYACAFHHAGLTTEERDIIESSFKNGSLKILVATSTLSSGVNLPARRVIIRSPLFGGKQMSSLTYKQMIGRAGRTGKDTLGESILICTDSNSKIGKDLVGCDLHPISSCLDMQNSVHLKRALIEVISSGVANNKMDINNFVQCTLLSVQKASEKNKSDKDREETIDGSQDCIFESLEFLKEYEFIRLQLNEETNDMNYVATRLGMACLASSMPPTDGLILFTELQKSRRCFVLESELHAVYLVTPYSVCYQMQDLDWLAYLDMWEKLPPAMKKVGELVGVKESFLVRAMRGQTKLDPKLLQIHKRFYTALALQELVNETPINEVAAKFKCNRGVLQSLQQTSSTFAGIVTAFCNSLNFTTLSMIVSQFKERLFFGVHRDLIDLMRLPDINYKRARVLFDSGIESLVDLANADLFTIEKLLYNSLSFDSAKQNENEDEYERNQRNNMRILYITGKAGLTVKNAAKLLINDARKFVQYEIGVKQINWSQNVTEDPLTCQRSCPDLNKMLITQDGKTSLTEKNPSEEVLKIGTLSFNRQQMNRTKSSPRNELKAIKKKNIDKNDKAIKRSPSDKKIKSRHKGFENFKKSEEKSKDLNDDDKSLVLSDKVFIHRSPLQSCRRSPRNHPQSNVKSITPKFTKESIDILHTKKNGEDSLIVDIGKPNKIEEAVSSENKASTISISKNPFCLQNRNDNASTESTRINIQKQTLNSMQNQHTVLKKNKNNPVIDFKMQNPKKNPSNILIEMKNENSIEINNKLVDNSLKESLNSPIANKSIDEIASSQDFKSGVKTQSSRFMHSHHSKKLNRGKIKKEKENHAEVNLEDKTKSIELSEISGSSLIRNPIELNASHIMSTSKVEPESTSFNCINIIDVCGSMLLFKNCLKELQETKQFGLAVGVQKLANKTKPLIGGNLLINQAVQSEKQTEMQYTLNNDTFIAGISFCINENIVFYLNMQNEGCCKELSAETKREAIVELIASNEFIIRIFDAKEQLKVLKNGLALQEINANIEDPKVANWLLQPDKELNLNQLAQQFAPECKSLTEIIAKGRGFSSVALDYNSSVFPKIRSAIEACVTVHILNGQIENLQRIGNGQLYKFYKDLEMPIQVSLCQMEIFGFPANENAMRKLFQTMLENLKKLELKIYELHGSRFNISSTSVVARILGLHKKSNGRFTTTKQILEKIDSPISQLIVTYRKLSVTIQKTIQPLLKTIVENRIYGHSITFSSTGRISMHEPNLQNVAKDFEVVFNETERVKISCRSTFFPSQGKCLISSDFCQLEMRILTHLSQDPALMSVMHSDKDVFTAIAAKWNKISEENVTEQLRNGTKQICYGIIYGMGMRTLADSLKCTEQEAKCLYEQFHLTYPGIRAYTQKVIRFARLNGYVETITQRRRYLDHISSEEIQLKNQAERKAINTTIQGSAADIAKSAIVRIEKNLVKYLNMLGIKKDEVNLVLHLHDELIYEIPESKASKIAKVIRSTMENCVRLSVPLHVKLKIGKSWGDLLEYKTAN